MFRHPRIERGNSGHRRLGDRIPRTLTPVKLDVEDASRSTDGSMQKTSTEAPVPGESSPEGIICIFCHQSFTKENLRYHGRYCQSNPFVDPNSGLFTGLGWYGTVSPATSNTGQPGKEDSSSPQGATDTAEGMDNDSDTKPPVQGKAEWSADEIQILIDAWLKGRGWTETCKHLPGRSPESLGRQFQELFQHHDVFLKGPSRNYEAELPSEERLWDFPLSSNAPIHNYEAERQSEERPPHFPSSSDHVVESYSHLEVVDNSDSDFEGEETSSFLKGYLSASREQLFSAAPDGDPSDSIIKEALSIITDLEGITHNMTEVQVDQKIGEIHSRIRHLGQFRVPNTGNVWPLKCHQCGSSIPLYDRELHENRQGLFSKCVMCRDHAQISTEIDSVARELEDLEDLEEELESVSGGGARGDHIRGDDARSAEEGHTSQTTTERLRLQERRLAELALLQRVRESSRLAPSTKQCNPPHPNDFIIGHDTRAPFTDSGYASGPIKAETAVALSRRPLQVSGDLDERNLAAQSSIIDEDAKTSYSAATSLDPICSRRYIQELSQDLYRNLQVQLDQPDWYSVSQVLPDLIKTFATKIGQEGDSQVYLDIMYFVHKRHRDIILHLKDLFQDDRLDGTRKEDPESMSLLDKMDLWNRKGAEGRPDADPSDLFEGITDGKEDGEIDCSVDLSSYNKIVLGCSAYSWLISRLRKQCTLQFGESQTSTSSGIRRCILEALPPASVSKRRRPQNHMVAFRFSWDSILRRFEIENNKQDLSSGIASIMTTTLASPDVAQMATVGDYFRQTWPAGGDEILRVLGEVLEGLRHMAGPEIHLKYGPVSFPSRTTILAIVRESHAVFSVTGLADAIAEYGEQLAWLTSALRPSREDFSVSASPELKQWPQRSLEASGWSNSPGMQLGKSENESHKAFGPKQRANRDPNPLSLAAGFDIEIWEQVTPTQSSKAPLRWCSRLLPDNFTPVFAKGFPIARRPEDALGLELPIKILREIQCEGMGLGGATNGSSRTWPHAGVKLNNKVGDVFYWRPTSAESSYGYGNRVDFEISGWEIGRHILQECSPDDSEKIDTPFESPHSSLLGSPTIDMLSLSSDSEQVGRRDFNSPGFLFFNKLFGRILATYHAGAGGSCGQGNGTTTGVVSSSNTSSFGTTSNPSQKRNRQILPGEKDEDSETPKAKRVKKEQPDCQRPRCFACPFWKLDSGKHWECILKKMTSISYVKQHLLRRHTPDFYCHRCFAIFSDAQTYDQHVLRASCFRDESAKFEGITHDQSRQLSKKVIGTVETQWFAMWRVLFPHEEPPRSIYVDFDQAVDLELVREFSHRHGVSILRDTIQSSGLLLRSEVSESELERVLGVGLDAMFDYFRLSRQPASRPGTVPLPSTSSGQPEMAPTHGRLSQQRAAGDTSSDSAVAMGYHSPGSSFSSPARHGHFLRSSFPATTAPVFEEQPSMPELAGPSLPRLPTNLRETMNSSTRGAEAHDSAFPAAFSSGSSFTGQLNEPLGGPIPSDFTGEEDGGPGIGPSDEVSGAEVFDLSESLGDGQSNRFDWEDLENFGPVDFNLDEILKGIVVEDNLLQRSLEWE